MESPKPTPTNVINLADRLEKRLMTAERSTRIPSLQQHLAGLTLSEELHQLFKHLIGMAEASRSGKATQAFTAVAMWRIAEVIRDGAHGAERLERKLRKAKKKARH